jgi:5-methyltetrahydropteroyltriglutamate--homocysteine methyltransferase
MLQLETPPFRADQVGSLLRPQRLIDARYRHGSLHSKELRELEDDCIREVIAFQERLGLKGVTDGEYRRYSWRSSFDGTVDGLVHRPAQAEINICGHVDMGDFIMDASPFTEGRIRRRRGIVTDEFRFLQSVTKQTPKITLPAPSFLHFFRGQDAIDRKVYPDLATYFVDIARVYLEEVKALEELGARYIQFDEVPIAMMSDAGVRARMAQSGFDPDVIIDLYLSMLNAVIASAGPDTTTTVHFCRGNSYGKSAGGGSFEPIAEAAFGGIRADALFIEFDGPQEQDFSPLRFVAKDKKVVLGLISTKTPALEDRDKLKGRIDQASKYVPLERLCISPQCGFSSRDKGTGLSIADETAKLDLLVSVAGSVWGF